MTYIKNYYRDFRSKKNSDRFNKTIKDLQFPSCLTYDLKMELHEFEL